MRFIPYYIWFLMWAVPFRIFCAIWQYVEFFLWSAQHEFKAGSTWVLKNSMESKQSNVDQPQQKANNEEGNPS